ncbi:hypothetical protein ACHAXS_009995, partial [Conticribra weissflogii]
MLLPLALKAALDQMNQLTVGLDGHTPEILGMPFLFQTNPKGIPKWEPWAQLGIYVGRLAHHAGNVALVLNPKTGSVSPQFHVIFEDNFST